MITSSSAVPLNSTELLAPSAHCFGFMSLNFSVVVQSLFSDQPRFQQKNLQSYIYPSVLHYLLSRLTFVPGASSVNPRSAGTRSSSVSTFNLKSAVIITTRLISVSSVIDRLFSGLLQLMRKVSHIH